MTKEEIQTFIEEMENHNDPWTEDEVKDVYGDQSLEDALTDRLSALSQFNIGLFTASMGASTDDEE